MNKEESVIDAEGESAWRCGGGEREGGRRISVAMRRGKTSRRLHETTHEVGDEGVARRVRTSASAAAAVPPRAAARDAPKRR